MYKTFFSCLVCIFDHARGLDEKKRRRSRLQNRSFSSPSPPKRAGCLWCSPKKEAPRRRSKEDWSISSDDWSKNDEQLFDLGSFSFKEQRKILKMAMKEQQKISREAQKIVKMAKQASASIFDHARGLDEKKRRRSRLQNRSFSSPSPPKRAGCLWCSPKKEAPRRRSKEDWSISSDDWSKNDELLSDLGSFSFKEQRKILKMAMKEQQKISREAQKIVKMAKQASARMNVSGIDDDELSD
uniref:Uncharacterized protein n=1 Tax=Cannabis sativa TaxID=3483 RepID=A0A803NXU6_CANSA